MSDVIFQPLNPLDVRDIATEPGKPLFKLLHDFTIRHNLLGPLMFTTIPAGRESDLGSVPDALKGIFPSDGSLDPLYWWHDEFYVNHYGRTRGNVDSGLRRGWLYFGLSTWKCWIAYYGVRAKAGSHWK